MLRDRNCARELHLNVDKSHSRSAQAMSTSPGKLLSSPGDDPTSRLLLIGCDPSGEAAKAVAERLELQLMHDDHGRRAVQSATHGLYSDVFDWLGVTFPDIG